MTFIEIVIATSLIINLGVNVCALRYWERSQRHHLKVHEYHVKRDKELASANENWEKGFNAACDQMRIIAHGKLEGQQQPEGKENG